MCDEAGPRQASGRAHPASRAAGPALALTGAAALDAAAAAADDDVAHIWLSLAAPGAPDTAGLTPLAPPPSMLFFDCLKPSLASIWLVCDWRCCSQLPAERHLACASCLEGQCLAAAALGSNLQEGALEAVNERATKKNVAAASCLLHDPLRVPLAYRVLAWLQPY
eukprot:1160429-Pelagomonas_calceolata.AAC.9